MLTDPVREESSDGMAVMMVPIMKDEGKSIASVRFKSQHLTNMGDRRISSRLVIKDDKGTRYAY
jgi:hypothetical protein